MAGKNSSSDGPYCASVPLRVHCEIPAWCHYEAQAHTDVSCLLLRPMRSVRRAGILRLHRQLMKTAPLALLVLLYSHGSVLKALFSTSIPWSLWLRVF